MFQRVNYEETMAGRIVLSVGFYMHASEAAHGETWGCTPEQKKALDELHLRKIDLADEVFVINVGRYVGESTAREIRYAMAPGKPVRWLEAWPYGPPDVHESVCQLHSSLGMGECDCKASDASDGKWGVGA
jgi:hypothetical protein